MKKASYFLSNTSKSPFGVNFVQPNEKVYLSGASGKLCLNSTITNSPFLYVPVNTLYAFVLHPPNSRPLKSFIRSEERRVGKECYS